jgi:hypothetical protein
MKRMRRGVGRALGRWLHTSERLLRAEPAREGPLAYRFGDVGFGVDVVPRKRVGLVGERLGKDWALGLG